MKTDRIPVCDGCKRHCPLNDVKCKYGRKLAAETACKKDKDTKPRHKWEKNVEPGGLAWRFLAVSRGAKKAIAANRLTEAQLFEKLNAEEAETFAALLAKLDHENTLGRRAHAE